MTCGRRVKAVGGRVEEKGEAVEGVVGRRGSEEGGRGAQEDGGDEDCGQTLREGGGVGGTSGGFLIIPS